MPGAGAGAVSWLCTWWRQVAGAGAGAGCRCGGAVSWLCMFQPVACQQVVGFCLAIWVYAGVIHRETAWMSLKQRPVASDAESCHAPLRPNMADIYTSTRKYLRASQFGPSEPIRYLSRFYMGGTLGLNPHGGQVQCFSFEPCGPFRYVATHGHDDESNMSQTWHSPSLNTKNLVMNTANNSKNRPGLGLSYYL